MADGVTPVLGLVKPEVGASRDTWGQKTNDNWDKIDQDAGASDTQFTAINQALAVLPFVAGTRLLFQQSAAPTGWTKDTAQNDKALRVVSGNVTVGGSVPFTTAFANRGFSGGTDSVATGGTVGDTALTIAQMPAHAHTFATGPNSGSGKIGYSGGGTGNPSTSTEGGSQPHGHSFTGSAHAHSYSGSIDITVQYVDVIIAVKN